MSQTGRRFKIVAISFVDQHLAFYGSIQELQQTGVMKGGFKALSQGCDYRSTNEFCAKSPGKRYLPLNLGPCWIQNPNRKCPLLIGLRTIGPSHIEEAFGAFDPNTSIIASPTQRNRAQHCHV